MAMQDQLEIISTTGQIEFIGLDPDKGVSNIGRHPENDIVIDSPGVALFQAVLDHRQKPFQIMNLTDEGEVRLRGERLAPNVFHDLYDWDTLELDGCSLILLETAGGVARPEPIPPLVPEPIPLPADASPFPEAGRPAPAIDQKDDLIVVELSAREWAVDVEQTATCQLTIANGGSLVATFVIAIEGLDPAWVTISPPRVNLYEAGRATVTVSMTAPRHPSSRAGAHPLSVCVTSPNYPGHISRMSGTLIVNPYYDFAAGDLSPKKQNVSYRRRSGLITVPVTNKGNCAAAFRLAGEDEKRACSFEFQIPGDDTSLAKQAEVRLQPEEILPVPIRITPLRRQLIALRKRHHNYTVTVTMVEGAQMPRSMMGSLNSAPLIGPGLILLTFLALAILAAFLFRPSAKPALEISRRDSQRPGAEVVLAYNACRFPTLNTANLFNRLNALFLDLTLESKSDQGEWQTAKSPADLIAPDGTLVETPATNLKYRLRADTWLSGLAPILKGISREVAVYVTPVEPKILRFGADRPTILAGQSVTLFWEVSDAESLILEHDGIEETLTDGELVRGHRAFVLDKNTTFTLTAGNSSWPQMVKAARSVSVLMPTPTPIPTPAILRFDVDPRAILVGETVRVSWEVTGADSVSIHNLGDGLSLKGDVGDQPPESTFYQLTAFKAGADGSQVKNVSQMLDVLVSPQPTASPVPVAPQIMVFESTPKEVIASKGQVVRLTWSVSGEITDVQISAPNLELSGLEAEDTMTVTVNDTTLFVLTASNGTLKTSKATEVKAIPPTATPEPTPIPTAPPPTATPFPPPLILFYKAEGFDPLVDKVIFLETIEGASGPTYVYQVQGGSRMKLSWEVRDAELVLLEGFGPQPSSGSVLLPQPVLASGTYMLTAINNGGANQVSALIQVQIFSPQPPPPPHNVTGVEDAAGGKNMIYWSYGAENRSKITGFRIYRADFPPGVDFVPVQTIYDRNTTRWIDEPDKTCGKAYYVVALYTDYVTGAEVETHASTTSWYSRPCN